VTREGAHLQDDCKYHCMHERMQQLHAAAPAFARTVKFHGKWPFTRVLGFQVWARSPSLPTETPRARAVSSPPRTHQEPHGASTGKPRGERCP